MADAEDQAAKEIELRLRAAEIQISSTVQIVSELVKAVGEIQTMASNITRHPNLNRGIRSLIETPEFRLKALLRNVKRQSATMVTELELLTAEYEGREPPDVPSEGQGDG